MTVRCRRETPEDEPFVRQLLAAAIGEDLGALGWPEPARAHLTGLQYQARRSSVRSLPGVSASEIIVADGEDAGWLLTVDLEEEIQIVEIVVLPARRGQGVGSAAIRIVLGRADDRQKPVRLGVNGTNARAIHLYERLGFRTTHRDEVRNQMLRMPQPPRP
jgi:ribosomal protein S18 acetylase RimI-like enzyme